MTRSNKQLIATLTLCLTTIACDGEPNTELGAELDELDEIVENLIVAGYPETDIEIDDDGQVIVGGDAVVSLEASREIAGANPHGFRQYRTNNLVSVSTICVNGSAFSGDMSTALDRAIASYNSQGLDFTMVRTAGSTNGCDATINAVVVNGTGGSAGFPSGGNPYGTIKIGDDIGPNYGLDALTHVVTHELGHCIGFRHTDYYNRSISCGEGGNEGGAGVGANHIPNTPSTAVLDGSVMNSCYNPNSDGVWTHSDVTALQELYGGSFCDLYDGQTIALRSYHGRYMRAGNSGESWQVNQQTSIGAWEKFQVVCDGAQAALKTAHNRYVRPRDSGGSWYADQQTSIGAWESLTPVLQSNGTFAFSTDHDRYLRAGNNNQSWRINQQTSVGPWETFTVIPQ